jgi:hypothetical protein
MTTRSVWTRDPWYKFFQDGSVTYEISKYLVIFPQLYNCLVSILTKVFKVHLHRFLQNYKLTRSLEKRIRSIYNQSRELLIEGVDYSTDVIAELR